MKQKIRTYPEDEYPGDDTAQHKYRIPKNMFLAAIAENVEVLEGLKIVVVALWKSEV